MKAGSLGGLVQDTLRLITVASGGFKLFRVAIAAVEIGGPSSCVISSTAKAGVISGRWFNLSSLFDRLATIVGGRSAVTAGSFPGLSSPLAFLDFLRMFTKVTVLRVSSLDEVINAAKIGNGPVVFAVYWRGGGGHAMVAFRDFLGRIRFADQYGRVVKNVAELGEITSVYGELMIVHDALIVQMARAGSVSHLLAAQVRLLHPQGMEKLDQRVQSARRSGR